MGQSYNEFYKWDLERMSRQMYQKGETENEVMVAAIKWIHDNIGVFSFESAEDKQTYIHDHLKRSSRLTQTSPIS